MTSELPSALEREAAARASAAPRQQYGAVAAGAAITRAVEGRHRLLFVQHCSERTGSTLSGLLVAEGFRNAGWDVDVVFGFDGPLISAFSELGCTTRVIAHKNWLRGGNFLQSARRMAAEWRQASAFARLMGEVRPDTVYVNSLVSLAAAIAARRARVPCVWHIRELFADLGGELQTPACGGRALVRRTLRRLATQLIAPSRVVAESVIGEADPALVSIVPNAAGDEFFELTAGVAESRDGFGLPVDVPVVGVPGTLRPVKGHPFFFDTAPRVRQSVPECVFAITGTGEPTYEAQLHQQVAQLGIAAQVRFLGNVADMPRFYRACDVVCVPSRSESFGRTVIEAFAVGTPVVASAVGGMRETIEDGVTGLLVEYGDVEGLRSALVGVLQDPAAGRTMAARAQRVAVERYSAENYQAAICDIVSGVARERRSQRPAGHVAATSLQDLGAGVGPESRA